MNTSDNNFTYADALDFLVAMGSLKEVEEMEAILSDKESKRIFFAQQLMFIERIERDIWRTCRKYVELYTTDITSPNLGSLKNEVLVGMNILRVTKTIRDMIAKNKKNANVNECLLIKSLFSMLEKIFLK